METPRNIFQHSAMSNLKTPRGAEHEKSPELRAAENRFFSCDAQKEIVQSQRKAYPDRKAKTKILPKLPTEEGGEPIPRRIMGFGLGFEKIFATTSTKLPVSAYTIFVEMHLAHNEQAFSRCFNGLHTVFDLKKWIYEKQMVPMDAYELSYAEPGKAALTDQLRLLTTQDSLDTRTLATTRAVHKMYKGVPGVHCVDDFGVTRLYVRLKCRGCGDLLNSLQTCRKHKKFGPVESPLDVVEADSEGRGPSTQAERKGIPGLDPAIEDCWYAPDKSKHCLFHTRGYELFEAARTHGGHAELARIYISCGSEPSKKLAIATNVLKKRGEKAVISY